MKEELPFRWSIDPPGYGQCPTSRERILGTFAIVNTIVTALSIFAGHEIVAKYLTFKLLSGGRYEKPWHYMFLLPVGLQLIANFTVVHVMKSAETYHTNYSSWELMLFYTTRPRLAFIALAFASRIPSLKGHGRPWASSFMSNMIAEVILQLISLYTMGQTVKYGVEKKYYIIGTEEYKSINNFTHIFYAGALYYLVAGGLGLVVSLVALYKIDEDSWTPFFCALFVLVTTWMASWLFWAGFVHAAGDDFCPPELNSQLFIWSGFSVAGVLLGVGP